jgi:hypothetical protein
MATPLTRRRRPRWPLGAVAAVALLVVVAAVVLGGGDDEDRAGGGVDATTTTEEDEFAEGTTTTEEFEEETTTELPVPTAGGAPGARVDIEPVFLGTDAGLLVELVWASPADLDIVVVEPDGTELSVNEPGPSDTGGRFDGDANARCRDTGSVERVLWPVGAVAGTYDIFVHGFQVDGCGSGDWSVTVRTSNATTTATGSVAEEEVDALELEVLGGAPPTTVLEPAPAPPTTDAPTTTAVPAEVDDDEGDGTPPAALAGLALLGALGAVAVVRLAALALGPRDRRPAPAPVAPVPARAGPAPRPRLPAPAELRELANHTIHRLDVARP